MATILAIILAVLLDRFLLLLPGGQVIQNARSSAWLDTYLIKSINFLAKLSIKQSYLIVLSVVLPLCIALFIVKLLCGILLGRIGTCLFLFFTLFYFLGFRQKTAEPPYNSGFVMGHENSFGVLFWFAVLGPTGALLYWFLVVSKQTPVLQENMNDDLRKALIWLHAMAAWIPSRITGFLYALVGNFTAGFKCWRQCMQNASLSSSQVLVDCGNAAVDANTAGDNELLVFRAYIAWVVLIIVIVTYL